MELLQAHGGCRVCGREPADHHLDGEGPLCDGCVDERIAAATGMPRLPDAPPSVVIFGADGRRHVLRYRIWRAPTGISVRLREDGVPVGEGFEFAVLGEHDADVVRLAARVRADAEAEIGRCYLESDPGTAGWRLAGDEAAGRLEGDPAGGPVQVVVDGRVLTWDELGEALASFEGWRFRLTIESSMVDVRSEVTKARFGITDPSV
ncbi:hypothetical protein AB0N07_33050 [Streptomyces sp. NPDC051172]|uniref:DUF7713 domain-containing protein n=1 Tax=Streptomyces sp. NPDC051172 TaxID=3155796 RepID=UPI003421AC1C